MNDLNIRFSQLQTIDIDKLPLQEIEKMMLKKLRFEQQRQYKNNHNCIPPSSDLIPPFLYMAAEKKEAIPNLS